MRRVAAFCCCVSVPSEMLERIAHFHNQEGNDPGNEWQGDDSNARSAADDATPVSRALKQANEA